jgi:hypothetical protein
MSSSKTAKLGLNQWQRSDFLIMDDFNADNAKLDAALDAVPWVKLLDVTTAASAAQVDIDLSGIDLTGYMDVLVCARLKNSSVYIRVNGLGSGSYSYNGSNSADYMQLLYGESDGSMTERIHLTDYGSSAACWLQGLNTGSSVGAGCSYNSAGTAHISLAAVTALNFVASSGAIGAGSRLVIYGMK